MSDRIQAFTVVLDKDIRDDDAESTLQALSMVKGVAAVFPVIAEAGDMIQRMRVRHEIRMRIYQAIEKILEDK